MDNPTNDKSKGMGFMCETRLLSDIMLRVSLAASGMNFEAVNKTVPRFWESEEEAQKIAEWIADSEAEFGKKRHATVFSVLLRLIAKEYLASMGMSGADAELNLKYMATVFAKNPGAFELGADAIAQGPVGPVRGKI